MDDIRLPRHVIDRLEHRWATRLQQGAKAFTCGKDRSVRASRAQSSELRSIQAVSTKQIPVSIRNHRSELTEGVEHG